MSKEKIRDYYNKNAEYEWKRLIQDNYHRLEFDTTMHFIKRYIKTEKLILDAGGGPGRYTIELAKLGHELVLFDLTPKLLDIAKQRIINEKLENNISEIMQGSFTDLSIYENNHFDAVICLGAALNHVLSKKERKKAISELIRVTKSQGLLFVSVISKLAVLIDPFLRQNQDMNLFKKALESGDYKGGAFAPSHFYTVDEFKEEFSCKKIDLLQLVGLEGLASLKNHRVNKWNKEIYNDWWKIHLKTCTHPAVAETSSHFLGIFKKK
ncbi:methyltransferase domain-containing protein [Candidatus Woesearchaeota archaeon]|nr:methyltransferase domain-containing protein [Candidatus Woesearchaeota archaeon]